MAAIHDMIQRSCHPLEVSSEVICIDYPPCEHGAVELFVVLDERRLGMNNEALSVNSASKTRQ